MKKNLLTLMFVMAFICVGVNVAKAETASSFSKINNKTTFIKLLSLCKEKLGPLCDAAIENADQAAQAAWGICESTPSQCQAAQDWAIGVLNLAMETCRNENPEHAKNIKFIKRTELYNNKTYRLASNKA